MIAFYITVVRQSKQKNIHKRDEGQRAWKIIMLQLLRVVRLESKID